MHIPAPIAKIVSAVTACGGKAYLVGGAVVDAIKGLVPKDWDIEVYNLNHGQLSELLVPYEPKAVGQAFGIFKLHPKTVNGLDVDVSVPRLDNCVGVGHSSFEVSIDPNMTPREAARRRDFTINSMAFDIVGGKLVDPFDGLTDLKAGILRATNPATFVQDPLRALRAMQLLARKAKTVDPETMELIRGMHGSFQYLAKERVHEEWAKLLLKADRPSVGLEFLRESGWLSHFPELQALVGCGQNPEWHPEGDAWVHSLHVVDSAAWARDHVDPEWKEAFMFGALLHDVGKPATTVFPEMVDSGEASADLLWSARGHDRAGKVPAEAFMKRITADATLIRRSAAIVHEHMQPYTLFQGEAKANSWKRLHGKLRLDVLGWMSRCDSCGKPDEMRDIRDPELEHAISDLCWEYFKLVGGPKPVAALLQGRDLIAAGYKPGRTFSIALKAAYEAQLDDDTLDIPALVEIARPHLAG